MASKTIYLKPEDEGIEISASIKMVGPIQFGEAPVLRAMVCKPKKSWDKYGPVVVGEDGTFSLKLPPGTKQGKLLLKHSSMRFVNSPEFTIESGVARFSGPIEIESACRLTIHVTREDGGQLAPIRGTFLRSDGVPALNKSLWGWEEERDGKIVLGPLVPTDQGWVVVKCLGYGTARVPLGKGLLKWRGDEEVHVELVPECKLSLKLHPLDGELAESASVRLSNSPWNLSYDRTVKLSGGGRAKSIMNLVPGTYHAVVEGKGLLPAVHRLRLNGRSAEKVVWGLHANPGLGVRGRVVTSKGQPVTNAIVQVRPVANGRAASKPKDTWERSDERLNPDCEWSGKTGANGDFSLSGFQRAKSFSVLVQVPPTRDSIPSGLRGLKVRRFLRENTIWTSRDGVNPFLEPIEISIGQHPEGIHGRVLDQNGEALRVVTIRAYADCDGEALKTSLMEGATRFRKFEDVAQAVIRPRDGEFQFPRLQGGSWTLLVTRKGYASQLIRGVEPGPEGILIAMPKNGSVVGAIVNTGGEKVQAAELILIDGEGASSRHHVRGEFKIKDVMPGEYTAWANVPGLGRSVGVPVQVLPGKPSQVQTLTLCSNGSIEGHANPMMRDRDLTLVLRQAEALAGFPRFRGEDRSIELGPKGSFQIKNVPPGNYSLEERFVDGEGKLLEFGSGFRQRVEVRPGQELEVSHGPGVADLIMEGQASIGGAPMQPGWICFHDTDSGQQYSAPVDEAGHYQVWLPHQASYNVLVAENPKPDEAKQWKWLANDWVAPGGQLQKNWGTASGAVKIRWVDGQGQDIQWVEMPYTASAQWFPEGMGVEFATSGVIRQDGVLSDLVPGASYRMRLDANSLFGDWLQARDVLFKVPSDGSTATIQIPCVPFAQE
ncbi:MAG: carboxypeptidase regulatory-like domain-containing protein [Planctomycetaceae bacterium]|nr:carboxypeptidase regulatory-like domain-containing protein [Planctomycetaceae bacterium]